MDSPGNYAVKNRFIQWEKNKILINQKMNSGGVDFPCPAEGSHFLWYAGCPGWRRVSAECDQQRADDAICRGLEFRR
jgi:hypothetical protein